MNDPALAEVVRETAGAERLVEMDPIMGGEDFSAYLRAAPGCFFFVGAGHEGAFPHHHPRFELDEDALPVAIATMTGAALRFLGQRAV